MDDRTLTVSELGMLMRRALEQAMPHGVWVAGEIRSINRSRNGHVYFDLVEPADTPGAAPDALVPVVLFRDNKDRVNRLLKRHGDPIRMTDGVVIRVQGVVDYYPPQGRIQLRMSTIDPTYTLGVLAADRDALLTRLGEEGLLRANGARSLTAVPQRVAVVTSIGSAAHADIVTVFEASGIAFTLVEVDTAVQGLGAEHAVAAAISAAGDADVDVVIVARGGGSKTDLATFDHEVVARAIAAAPVPVVTGVGHDIDRSVADEVAHSATTTPTAAAQFVVARVETWLARLADHEAAVAASGRWALDRAEERLVGSHRTLRIAATGALGRAEQRLAHGSHRLSRSARRADVSARGQLDRAVGRIDMARRHALRAAERRVDAIAARARALDPALALARGWSITRSTDGRVVRSVADVAPGSELVTRIADGTVTSTITDTSSDTATEETGG